ncbi:MAG TPA: acyloxyacyl hydrolase [Candidatus Binatia bacterium]|nr:acyloxyacyl hydrolase [Candidatus Binatia bacterium]
MTRGPLALGLGALALLLLLSAPAARGYDPNQAFMQGSLVVSPEAAYGHQFDLEHKDGYTGLDFANIGVRLGWLPFKPLAADTPVYGSLEIGLEPLYQQYISPKQNYFAGLGMTYRYHFLSLGRFVPYFELAAFAGGTNLKVTEIRSDFTFLLWGGVGASYFVSDRTAVYTGYRYEHVSNGHTSTPNRGFESNVGVLGMSFFFE